MANKILFISDSHGTDYGVKSYVSLICENLVDKEVKKICYGGKPIDYFIEKVLSLNRDEKFDFAIIQIGNPDVHPRMPHKILKYFRSKGLTFCRDSLFSIPPSFNLSYILRFPFFLLRLILIRFYREYYNSNKEIQDKLTFLVKNLEEIADKIIILPLLKVNHHLYGEYHNNNVDIINDFLRKSYPDYIFTSKNLGYSVYKKEYNLDGFHFRDNFHIKLSEELIKIIG
ncbi:hypothetical protein H1215_18960 [Anoxybacillus sp. LAT_38]|uniref:hypothetical protein n=1 Tax=Anoxybacillus sp. LAT_26 TaxID=2862719 RepID=UPI001EEA0C35|nr:hypothetical protein [Anoxybacillus sp. LAT_26]MCG6184563.1 hypothetical protein [Anoxybacillus sp. LAT_26]MCG6199246.1 hypothetical protein [Anoxybacillus sp. LAT_38]